VKFAGSLAAIGICPEPSSPKWGVTQRCSFVDWDCSVSGNPSNLADTLPPHRQPRAGYEAGVYF